jgi:hypothetical protein
MYVEVSLHLLSHSIITLVMIDVSVVCIKGEIGDYHGKGSDCVDAVSQYHIAS